MNRNFILPFLFIIAAAFLVVCCSCKNSQQPAVTIVTQDTIPAVIIPELPKELSFAGERVPLENNDTRESLQREIIVTMYMHSRTMLTLLNTKRYFTVIEHILKSNGLHDDFKYLCIAESGLNPNAVSVAKAGGLWQFMPKTGTQYGLEVGSDIDERFHVEKATEAACRYLTEGYQKMGSWTLAAAGYNLGDSGVIKRLENQEVKSYYDVFMPEETMRYVFRILAWKVICENPNKYGFHINDNDWYLPYSDFKEIEVSSPKIDWSKLAIENETTYKLMRELNPWIRTYEHTNKSGKVYKVRIPAKNSRTVYER